MNKSNFRKIQKLVALGLQELEKELIADGIDITSPEADQITLLAKTKLLGEFGLTLEEYDQLKADFKKKPTYQELEDKPEIPVMPTVDEIKAIAKEVIPPPVAPQIINKTEVIERTTNIVEKPTIKIERQETIVKELDKTETDKLRQDLSYLQESFANLSNSFSLFPTPPDYSKEIKGLKDFADNASIVMKEMPNWRALGMGLQGQIDEVRAIAQQGGVSLWDDSGTYFTQHTPNYPVNLGSGNLTTTGKGTFGSTYQAVLGDDANTNAGSFTGGTSTVTLADGDGSNFVDSGGYSARIGSATEAGYFSGGGTVYLGDSTYAINAIGNSLFTGALTLTGIINANGGSIKSSTGAISFDNENLSTTGTLGAGATTLTSINVGTNTLVANLAGYLGNVGIGTAAPSQKLQIYGGTVYTNIWLVATGLGYGNPTNVETTGDGDKILFLNAGTAKTGYGTYQNNGLWIQSSAPLTEKALSVWNGVSGINMTERFTVQGNGKTGINTVYPLAWLHLPAGTATATEAPLKFTSGVFNTVAELGAMEYDGQNYKLNGGLFLNSAGLAYTNPLGSGNRSLTLTLTTTATYVNTLVQYINGNTTSSSFYWNNQAASGLYIRFDFGVAKIITEAKHYQGDTSSHGTWKWQGSNNAIDWTDIGATFTYGGATTQTMTTLSGNITAYRYYQMLGTAGNMSANPYIYEIEFKIGIANQFAIDALGNISTLGTITGLLRPPAGAAVAGTAPLKFTAGVITTAAVSGQLETDASNNLYYTDATPTRRYVVGAPNTTKVTAGAPYTNDGYIVINIGGTDFKVMTTA